MHGAALQGDFAGKTPRLTFPTALPVVAARHHPATTGSGRKE